MSGKKTVGITNGIGRFAPLYINLARTLIKNGHSVVWLWSTFEEETLLKKHCPDVIRINFSKELSQQNVATKRQFEDHVKAFIELGIFTDRLKAHRYCLSRYQTAKDVFKKYEVDTFVVFNGCTYPEADAAEDQGIEVWYCENGYFPNTFQCNKKGVNAKAEYANFSRNQFLQYSYPKEKLPLQDVVVFNRNYLVYFFTKIVNVCTFPKRELVGLYNIFRQKLNQYRNQKIKVQEQRFQEKLPEKYLLYPLQCTHETQLWLNSDFSSIESTIEPVIQIAKKLNIPVVLKEHPADYTMRSYQHFSSSDVFVTRMSNIEDLISQAHAVIVMNSSTGLQAAGRYKSVYTFGRNMYSVMPNVEELNLLNPDINLLSDEKDFSKYDVDELIKHYKENIFLPGNWRNPDAEFISRLAGRIVFEKSENDLMADI
jgi:capsular polysaccharide export protein